ncbi:hypothetical protein J2X68_003195 [Streptomyces sp. 3330]|uniref:hypothetical protein n=1 Tax=Streptomyces sp. 3330 TaxID=2817755 RepID=UPI002864DCD2|nr:hypothetical protein [Streptomyces sp. 3330]MDR6976504.1 hypothetical protein [Streptomyces sp. 3330]
MAAEAAHLSARAPAAPTVSSYPAVARQVADALRWFFACEESGGSPAGREDGGSRARPDADGRTR